MNFEVFLLWSWLAVLNFYQIFKAGLFIICFFQLLECKH